MRNRLAEAPRNKFDQDQLSAFAVRHGRPAPVELRVKLAAPRRDDRSDRLWGTKRTCRDDLLIVGFRSEADVHRHVALPVSAVDDPQPTKASSKSRSAVGLQQCYLPLEAWEKLQ
jgi:hypothetical protein